MASQHGSTSRSTSFDEFSCEYWEHRSDARHQPTIIDERSSAPLENTIDAWRKLADPSTQVRPDGIGTGRLHRMGKNFKPVDEELLLQQEMAYTSANGGMPMITENRPPDFMATGSTQQQRPTKQTRTPTRIRVEDLSQRPATPGGWGSGKLSTVPFWEQQQQQQQQELPATSSSPPPTTASNATTTITIPLTTVSSTLVSPTYIYTPSPELRSPNPLLEFHVTLVPGVAITFTMHEGEDPVAVIERVMRKHRLNVNTEVKRKISKTLQLLHDAKMNEGNAKE